MEINFKHAFANQELCVWYQPQVDMQTGKICGAEALVRRQKNGRQISPLNFIPALEESGQIVELDREVLRVVCRDIREAKRRGACLGPVSVNLSRRHMGQCDAAEELIKITEENGAEKEDIVFELTETAVCRDDKEDLEQFMGKLSQWGFQISLDDFGIGFSALKLLADIPFHILKLDRYFVSRIGDPRIEIILSATVDLAWKLGINVIAEGVENTTQIRFLLENSCFTGQGYYFFKPMPQSEYLKQLLS